MMRGQITDTTRAVYLVDLVDHYTQAGRKDEHKGRLTWRALAMAAKRGGYGAAHVYHDTALKPYAMQYRLMDSAPGLNPIKEIDPAMVWLSAE